MREFHSAIFLAVTLLFSSSVWADDLTVLPEQLPEGPKTKTLERYLLREADEALLRRKEKYEALKTPEQLTAYQNQLREFFVAQLGGFPERTPLNARVVGQKSYENYRIEKIIFESRPGHFVTGVLYSPLAKGPHPGVIVPCGHSANGKAAETYQRACILMATNGLVSFCYDPIGQGERLQILPAEGEQPFASTLEHTLVGMSSIPLGTNTARYRIWDGMRALDYLASRSDIIPSRLGCTGNSGGGTLTSYLMALDERILAAAPSCYLTTMDRLLHTIGAQDAEQNIHAQVSFGLDHPDYVLMRAPRPTLMCVATRDFFDINGAWDNFRQSKRFYTRLGYPERIDLVETDETHGFSIRLREGATRWMRRWLLNVDEPLSEGEFSVASDQDLQCTPDGQTLLLPGARSVFDLNQDWAESLATQRQKARKAFAENGSSDLMFKDRIRSLIGLRSLQMNQSVESESIETLARDGYSLEKLLLRSEPGIVLPALLFRPEKISKSPLLYIHGSGKQADAGRDGAIEKLVRLGHVVLAVDLRGTGETLEAKPMAGWDEHIGPDWRNYFLAYMLDKTYVGMWGQDIIASARFLQERFPDRKDELGLISRGATGTAALHVLALESSLFREGDIRDSLDSWETVISAPQDRPVLSQLVHGSLAVYDLPDLVRMIPKEKLHWEPTKP